MQKDNRKPTTTDAGIPVASDEYSLTVGPDWRNIDQEISDRIASGMNVK